MKCPGCGAKYKGKKCPECGRHTDPGAESKQYTKIALLVVVLIFVAVVVYYLFTTYSYYNGIQEMIQGILG